MHKPPKKKPTNIIPASKKTGAPKSDKRAPGSKPEHIVERTTAAPSVSYSAFAIAAPGLAPLLAKELRSLGVPIGEISAAGVEFQATVESLFMVNLWSRLATRVLVRLATFTARDFATLEKQSAKVVWSRVVSPGARVRFRVTCKKSRLYHSDAVAERIARGVSGAVKSVTILDRARGDDDALDDSSDLITDGVNDSASNEQLIVVRFEHDVCTISADSSGELLHKRGWRQAIAKAPLRENLAAAMLVACEWTGESALVDPFCGSGTIGIEAALLARNIAPGINRSFAMEQWPGVNRTKLGAIRGEARATVKPSVEVPIVMSDRDAGACEAARANAERAGVLSDVEIVHRPLSEVQLSSIASEGLVLSNPPYGVRVSEGADLRNLYTRVGDVVREGGRGWRLAMLVPDRRWVSPSGLTFDSLLKTSNGGIGVSVEASKLPRAR